MKTFTVEYCYNWDGGDQELSTAKKAILAVHPKAKIIEKGSDDYPILVKIYDENNEKIFETDQRNLFSKNASKRKESIDKIMKIVQGL